MGIWGLWLGGILTKTSLSLAAYLGLLLTLTLIPLAFADATVCAPVPNTAGSFYVLCSGTWHGSYYGEYQCNSRPGGSCNYSSNAMCDGDGVLVGAPPREFNSNSRSYPPDAIVTVTQANCQSLSGASTNSTTNVVVSPFGNGYLAEVYWGSSDNFQDYRGCNIGVIFAGVSVLTLPCEGQSAPQLPLSLLP